MGESVQWTRCWRLTRVGICSCRHGPVRLPLPAKVACSDNPRLRRPRLRCEPNTLGYPPAALFAFCTAIACYNLVAAMLGAVRVVHGQPEAEKLSSHQVAEEL